MDRDVLLTKKFLEQNKGLLVLEADKGKAAVIMEREVYKKKMLEILRNEENYKLINKDPTSRLQKKSNEFVNNLQEKGWVETRLAKFLKQHDSVPPKIYGLPKVHKEDFPLRPIVSAVKSPLEALSRFLASILDNLKDDTKNIRSSGDLQKLLENIQVADDDTMASFDVVGMFPSVPVDLALKIVLDRWDEVKNYTPLDQQTFSSIFEFCLKSGYCQYEGEFYLQKNGLSIGSPLSPVVAEIVLDFIFGELKKFAGDKIKFMTKYVDDSFFILSNKDFDDVFEFLNNFHSRIKFTYEKSMTKIDFLDISIQRDVRNNEFKFRHFKKLTYTGRIINFHSNNPMHFKRNTAVNILRKWMDVSDVSFHNDLISEFRIMMKKNCYSDLFVNSIVDYVVNVNIVRRPRGKIQGLKYFRLPYVSEGSILLKKCLENLDPKIKIAFGNYNTLKDKKIFSKAKDLTPLLKNSGVIYSVPCSDCSGIYVGETEQYLSKRLSSHKSDVRHEKENTALASHAKIQSHSIDFDNVSILAREDNRKRRKIREVVEIIKEKNAVNFKSDSKDLFMFYSHVIG